jgi:hypothetical protein
MTIDHPEQTTYWILACDGQHLSGVTLPTQATAAGPMWDVLLQTTDNAAWEAERLRLGIEPLPGE